MAATYVPVPAAAFAESLAGFQPGIAGDEVTYAQDSQRVPRLRLVVYTSLAEGREAARAVGADAVRVALVAVTRDGKTRGVRSFSRINRVGTVEGVLTRVRDRIAEARRYARANIQPCARCGAPAYADSGRCVTGCR